MNLKRANFINSPAGILGIALCLIGITLGVWYTWSWFNWEKPIRVGLLHSLTGPMAISEKSMVDAEILALEQINAQGGLLGRQLEWVVADGKSDWPTFAREAEKLIKNADVEIIIGCWTSASRKMVREVVEANNHLLIYPMAFEGLEESENIIYTGSAPNQQIIPAVTWAKNDLKAKRFYLVGSDYIWPHSVNEIIKDVLKVIGAEVAGESYLFFGTNQVDHVVQDIVETKPDVIISTVVGDSNKSFYQELYRAGIRSNQTPVISFSVAEDELNTLLKEISPEAIVGHYSAWNYFQSIERPENTRFINQFRAKYGNERSINDTMTASYNSVLLWAQAVREAESTEIEAVVNAMSHQSLDAPEGIVTIDAENNYTWRPVYIARAQNDGQFQIAWSTEVAIRPEPYPATRPRKAWEMYLQNLYRSWDNSWANPRDVSLEWKKQKQAKSDTKDSESNSGNIRSDKIDSPPAPSDSQPDQSDQTKNTAVTANQSEKPGRGKAVKNKANTNR